MGELTLGLVLGMMFGALIVYVWLSEKLIVRNLFLQRKKLVQEFIEYADDRERLRQDMNWGRR